MSDRRGRPTRTASTTACRRRSFLSADGASAIHSRAESISAPTRGRYPRSGRQATYRSISAPIHDPRTRSTVCGLTKYVSNIGQLPLCGCGLRKHPRSDRQVMCPSADRSATGSPQRPLAAHRRPHDSLGHRSRNMFQERIRGRGIAGAPPQASKARTWAPSQWGSSWLSRASAYVWFDAPRTATKSWACQVSPVAGSVIGMVCPAKSTKAFSPARWSWRRTRSRRPAYARYRSVNQVYPKPSGQPARYSVHYAERGIMPIHRLGRVRAGLSHAA